MLPLTAPAVARASVSAMFGYDVPEHQAPTGDAQRTRGHHVIATLDRRGQGTGDPGDPEAHCRSDTEDQGRDTGADDRGEQDRHEDDRQRLEHVDATLVGRA